MINRKAAQARMKAIVGQLSKPQCRAWQRLQPQAQESMIQFLQEQFDLIPAYYGVLAEAIVSEIVDSKIKSVSPNAPSVLLSDKEWLEGILIDCKKLLVEWDESGKAEEILDEWERNQESLKHGI